MPAFDDDALKAAILKRLQADAPDHADPAAAVPEKKGIGPGPYLAMIGGHLGDAITTKLALKNPNLVEGNPILNGFGPAGIAMKSGSALLTALLMRKLASEGHDRAAKLLGYGTGAGMGALAARNATLLSKTK